MAWAPTVAPASVKFTNSSQARAVFTPDLPPVRFISRNGVVDPTALAAIQGKRFIRLSFEFESDTQTNAP